MRILDKRRFGTRASKRKDETESNSTEAIEPPTKRISKRIEKNKEQKEASSSMAKSSNISTSAMEASSSTAESSNAATSTMKPTSSKTRSSEVSSSVMGDGYCWLCVTETDENICVTCHRAWHESCLGRISATFSELGVCPECQSKSVDGTELSSSKYFNYDKLKRMLDALVRRSYNKKRAKYEQYYNGIFLRWPKEDQEKLFKIIDFEILMDNIYQVPLYTKTAEFYGDVKYLLHNSIISYEASSDEAKAAENLRRDFKSELKDLEACPECYYHMYCEVADGHHPFVRLCETSHDIVWAQLYGHPYWPAKCLKVIKDIAHVRFFGEHEVSNIPIKKCFFMSQSHPKFKNSNIYNPENSGPKSQRYESARSELTKYIRLYERKYGPFPFYPHKTLYKPQEKTNEVIIISAEGSSNIDMRQMKLEGFMDEDSEAIDINAETVMEHSEENLPFPRNDIGEITSPNGQYSTPLDDIVPSLNVVPTTLSCESGSNNNPSHVTSINMSFSSDENPSNNVQENSVFTSIESLQPTASAPTTLSSESDTTLRYRLDENYGRMIQYENSEISEALSYSEIPSGTVANNASSVPGIPPGAIQNVINNICHENQLEPDDEISIIGQKRKTEEEEPVNPEALLSYIEHINPEMKDIIEKTRYSLNGMIVLLWAASSKNMNTIGKLSKMSVDLRKCKSDLQKMKEENDNMMKENSRNKLKIRSLTDEVNEIKNERSELAIKLAKTQAERDQATDNAKAILKNLRKSCNRRLTTILREEHMQEWIQLQNRIVDLERTKNSLEEQIREVQKEKRQVEKTAEEHLAAWQRAEEKVKFLKIQRPGPDSDDISTFKKMHYCTVCEEPAGIVCCLNTSYCSRTCQERHTEEHRQFCKREVSRQILQQTVCKQTFSQTVSVKERSKVNSRTSDSQEIADFDSTAGSSHHKETEISTSVALSASGGKIYAAASRSYSSKTKHR